MPMTVISVSRQRQAHPAVALGLDHAQRAGLGDGEVGAADADLRGQELAPQVPPRRLGQRGRVVGQAGVDVGHLAQEELADLGPVAVDRRHQDVRGPVVAELHDQLGQVGLVGRDPAAASASFRPISSVVSDLTLTTSVGAGRPDQLGDDLVRLGRVPGPVDRAAARGDRLLELLQIGVEVAIVRVLDRLAGRAQLLPVGQLADDLAALGADRLGGVARGCGAAGCRPARAAPPPGTARAAAGARRRAALPAAQGQVLGLVAARISARWTVRTPARSRDRPPPMCIRQELSPAVQTSAPVSSTCASCRPASRSRCRRS